MGEIKRERNMGEKKKGQVSSTKGKQIGLIATEQLTVILLVLK